MFMGFMSLGEGAGLGVYVGPLAQSPTLRPPAAEVTLLPRPDKAQLGNTRRGQVKRTPGLNVCSLCFVSSQSVCSLVDC
ncbi:hypothetical protein CKAH01_09939 [Colletotrichum kahawae]|uniref:Uncharacterized protein n=1 Tax=Colletotrichum kahawae TaxID=34407 RepID=A0AAE0CY49_COLKA|nr:hypothetical protein CKAH01_09939 [Colletotrichum kahawae]